MQTGGNYLVTAINTTTNFTLQYLGGGVAPTPVVTSGKKVTPTGSAGADGKSALTVTTASFTVPAIASTVNVSVEDSSIFNTNIFINIDGAGEYQVTVIVNSTTITAKNLGGDDNAAESSTIGSGSQIIISGARGATGSVVATSALVFDSAISPPTTSGTEYKAFINLDSNNELSLRLPSNGATKRITFFDQVKDALLTGFSASTATAILATDTIIEALQKVQKYLTDYLTNFNGANQLVKLTNNSELPVSPYSVVFVLSDETTDLTTGTAKLTYRIYLPSPYTTLTLTDLIATLNAASTGSSFIIDINKNGVSILTNKLSIDATETTSVTASIPYSLVNNPTTFANGDLITFDIDQIGSTVAGKGAKVNIQAVLTI
jgi:hypothetical protein